MAKAKKPTSQRPSVDESLAKLERPQMRWKAITQIAVAFAIIWITSLMIVPCVGYWGVGISGVLTLVAIGFGIYIYRLTRKSAAIVDILRNAKGEQGRQEALEKLEARGDSNDALNSLARAQLVAQEKPGEAIEILEGVDLKKAPAVVQDDVRANLALLYLLHNRVRDARALADDMRLDRQPQAKLKAMYAAVIAESFSRTGKPDEAKKLLETYNASDPDYGEVRGLLLRAQVYTYAATKNRGLARQAMEQLADLDPNMLAPFVRKGANPELLNIAKQLLTRSGMMPKPKMRVRMR